RLSSTITLARFLFDTYLIHTGQNYDYHLNDIFFNELEIAKPDHYLDCIKDNCGKTVGDIIGKTYDLFKELQPDAVLILGDTNSCLCSYSAKRLKIPIFHLEAGNRSFDPNVPEEINRKIIDHIADINMCYMEQARSNLLRENIKSQYTFVIGSPMPEVYASLKDKIALSTVLHQYELVPDEYFVWSSHREDNVDNETNLIAMIDSINKLANKYDKKIVFGAHPRTKKMIDKHQLKLHNNILITEPFGIIDYYSLLRNAKCVITDSGTISEEANILKIRCILLRISTEHPEVIDAGSIIIGNIHWEYLEQSIHMCLKLPNTHNAVINYMDTNFSEKVCKIISGYTSIVNKFLWMK
ncbi:UDP-N-acetylglucosamine 2-epimerase (non-hydrolyzing), partial [Nitrosopumilus sp.]|nr:UDP-N-acetylglucosamine 2-epimerase (non-hydrolyzing) [Nitrosopumilus sp.]